MVTIPQNFNCHSWKNDFYFDLVIFDNQANLMGMLRCETFVNYCVMRSACSLSAAWESGVLSWNSQSVSRESHQIALSQGNDTLLSHTD